jgi:hypothetical protein
MCGRKAAVGDWPQWVEFGLSLVLPATGGSRSTPDVRPVEVLAPSRSFAGGKGMWRDLAEDLICLSPLFGVLQNDTAPMIIGNPPFFDLIQGTKAAEAGKVVV